MPTAKSSPDPKCTKVSVSLRSSADRTTPKNGAPEKTICARVEPRDCADVMYRTMLKP